MWPGSRKHRKGSSNMEGSVVEGGSNMEGSIVEDSVMESIVMEDSVMESGIMECGNMEHGGMERGEKSGSREMTCICCPLGCGLTVTMGEDGRVSVSGNTCPRGAEYGKKELLHPERTVTTTVRAAGRKNTVISVKTASDIPKEKIMECMKELAGVEVKLPVRIGDVVLEDVAGTGVNVIATRNAQ